MPAYYPPVGFHFKVEVLGASDSAADVRFTEVSGLSVEMLTEELAEGGENRFVQKYPVRAKYPELSETWMTPVNRPSADCRRRLMAIEDMAVARPLKAVLT